jgi:hypothetical protein
VAFAVTPPVRSAVLLPGASAVASRPSGALPAVTRPDRPAPRAPVVDDAPLAGGVRVGRAVAVFTLAVELVPTAPTGFEIRGGDGSAAPAGLRLLDPASAYAAQAIEDRGGLVDRYA